MSASVVEKVGWAGKDDAVTGTYGYQPFDDYGREQAEFTVFPNALLVGDGAPTRR